MTTPETTEKPAINNGLEVLVSSIQPQIDEMWRNLKPEQQQNVKKIVKDGKIDPEEQVTINQLRKTANLSSINFSETEISESSESGVGSLMNRFEKSEWGQKASEMVERYGFSMADFWRTIAIPLLSAIGAKGLANKFESEIELKDADNTIDKVFKGKNTEDLKKNKESLVYLWKEFKKADAKNADISFEAFLQSKKSDRDPKISDFKEEKDPRTDDEIKEEVKKMLTAEKERANNFEESLQNKPLLELATAVETGKIKFDENEEAKTNKEERQKAKKTLMDKGVKEKTAEEETSWLEKIAIKEICKTAITQKLNVEKIGKVEKDKITEIQVRNLTGKVALSLDKDKWNVEYKDEKITLPEADIITLFSMIKGKEYEKIKIFFQGNNNNEMRDILLKDIDKNKFQEEQEEQKEKEKNEKMNNLIQEKIKTEKNNIDWDDNFFIESNNIKIDRLGVLSGDVILITNAEAEKNGVTLKDLLQYLNNNKESLREL